MISVDHQLRTAMHMHARQTYPEECCGILLGNEEGGQKHVTDIVRIQNAREENRNRRFVITPEDYRDAERRAAGAGQTVLGFYHSHPDHPAVPSQFDLDHAMPWCSYIIIAVDAGIPVATRSWVLADDRSAFHEEEVGFPSTAGTSHHTVS